MGRNSVYPGRERTPNDLISPAGRTRYVVMTSSRGRDWEMVQKLDRLAYLVSAAQHTRTSRLSRLAAFGCHYPSFPPKGQKHFVIFISMALV